MKIAIIIEHFDPSRTQGAGAERLAVWLAREFRHTGHEVHVICHDVSARINRYRQATLRASHDADQSHRAVPPIDSAPAHDGLHIHRLRGMRLSTAIGFRVFGVRARQWVRRNKPDLVHSFTVACPGDIYHAVAGVFAAMQSQSARSRQTMTRAVLKRLSLRFPGKQRSLVASEGRAVRSLGTRGGVRRILSPCPMTTRHLESLSEELRGERLGKAIAELPTPRLELATPDASERHSPAAGDPREWFRAHYGLGKTDRVALFVGHDFRRLGLRYAIEAVARTESRWKLLVVGMGKMREYVELADALGLGLASAEGDAGRVLFVGPTREVASVYSAADALLLPAFYEPSSGSLLDALSFGLPVVGTEFIAIADLVTTHHAGTIVASPRDVDGLAAALDGLPAGGSAEQKNLSRRARAAGTSITPGAYMEAILKLYGQIRAEKSRGASA